MSRAEKSPDRLALIDIGSNSIRLTVVELEDPESWKVLAEERDMTRLADRLASTGRISSESMARSIDAIVRFHAKAQRLGVSHVLATATSAVREAENREEFLTLVRERAGLHVEIIAESDEGRLTFASVQRTVDLSKGICVVVDIGGGSLEVVVSHEGVVTHNVSLPLGAVRLTDAFGGAEESAGPRRKEMAAHVDELLRQSLPTFAKPPRILVGCGGAFTTLASMTAAAAGLRVQASGRKGFLHLAAVRHTQVRAMLKLLKGTTVPQRLHMPGLQPDRADIIVAGLTVIDRLMKFLGVRELRPHGGGVRDGLILRTIEQSRRATQSGSASPKARAQAQTAASLLAARNLAARCKAIRPHGEAVATVALSLYDQFRALTPRVIDRLGSDRRERVLLEAGCVLHDVGQLVEYRKHHRHGESIVRFADLPEFSAREIEILALLARHHRKGEPSEKNPAFAALPKKDQALVTRLCAILRVADGLDRSHTGCVQSVTVEPRRREIRLRLAGNGDLAPDLESGRAKASMLTGVCGRKIVIQLPAVVKAKKKVTKKARMRGAKRAISGAT